MTPCKHYMDRTWLHIPFWQKYTCKYFFQTIGIFVHENRLRFNLSQVWCRSYFYDSSCHIVVMKLQARKGTHFCLLFIPFLQNIYSSCKVLFRGNKVIFQRSNSYFREQNIIYSGMRLYLNGTNRIIWRGTRLSFGEQNIILRGWNQIKKQRPFFDEVKNCKNQLSKCWVSDLIIHCLCTWLLLTRVTLLSFCKKKGNSKD